MEDGTLPPAPLKAPRAGAIAGIVFSLLLIVSVVLTRISIPPIRRMRERGFPLVGRP